MLNHIIKFSIHNKIIIGIFTILLIIWGIWSATKLPIDALPDITNNQVQIITVCPTLAGQEVEQLITFPIEQSIANVPDIEETRSISRFGLSVITVVFKESVDIYFARQLITEKINEAKENMPTVIGTPALAPISTGLGEVYQYILHPKKGSKNNYSSMELRTMQDWMVARQLYGIPGIAEVNSFGGQLKQYEVSVNPQRLRAMGVTIPEIFETLQKNNQNTGGAYIDDKPNSYFIRGIGRINSIEDIKNIVVRSNASSVPIFIRDVADVKFGSAVRYGAMTYNGDMDAVGGVVMMLKGENSNEVVNRIKEKIPTIQKSLPDDVVIEPFLDRTELVDRAIGTVEKNLLEGALIVIFVLVLFLGNFRAGLIVASAIPLSLLFALGMMNVFGVSANLMSLGAIDFGLIVDGAVIIVEATMHHLGLRKSTQLLTQQEMDEEVYVSASKIRNSAAFGEIIILIVYIPILTLIGIEGKMFGPMAKTVGFAILGALILSLTYIPTMCALFLPKSTKNHFSFSDKMMIFFQKIYQPLLERAIRFKFILVGTTVVLFAFSIFLFSRMGGEFIPTLNEGDFAFHCILPQGASLSQSIETSMQASRILKQFEEVKMVVGKTGSAEVPTDPMPPEASDIMIILKPKSAWKNNKSYEELGDEMMEKLEVIPGVFFEKNQPIQMRFNELMTGVRQDVAVKIFGENLDSLNIYAEKTGKLLQTIEGISVPQIERVSGLPQINIEYDRNRMANYGLNIEDVNTIISTAFAGSSAGVIYENERKFDLVVRLDSTSRGSIDDVKNILIPTTFGSQIPLSQIANISYKLGAAQISREAGKRRIVIGFNAKNRDVKSIVHEIQEKLNAQIKLPVGYYFSYGGTFENLEKASNRLMIAVPLSLLLIFILLFMTFNSISQATLIFTAIPMSAIGGVLALYLRDMPFSISAGVGFIALFGVAVLNGIVLIGTFNQLENEGMHDIVQRVIEGTKIRLRPVLMTATVASLGFLPMAISQSAGAEVQKPLATVVIGGLASATLLTLFVLPLLYILFNSIFKKIKINLSANIIVIFLIGCTFSNVGFAQDSRTITINQALKMVEKNNLELKAKKIEIQTTQSKLKTANDLPKLEINTQFGQYSSIKFDNAFSISQTIPFPSIFAAKKQLVQAEINEKEWQKKMTLNELNYQVKILFNQLAFLNHQQKKITYLDSLYQVFIQTANARFKAGEGKKLEISNAETKRGEIQLLLQQNKTDSIIAYQSLKNVLNSTEYFSIVLDANYELLEITSSFDSTHINTHPIIQLLNEQANIAEQTKKVEKAKALPDFTIGYTNQSLIGFQTIDQQEKYFNAGKRFHIGNLSIHIPVSIGATKAQIKSLEYQKQATQAIATYQQTNLLNQYNNAVTQQEQQLQEYMYLKNKAIPNANEMIQVAQAGYRSGDINYIEYLMALQNAGDVHLNYLKKILQLNESIIFINTILQP